MDSGDTRLSSSVGFTKQAGPYLCLNLQGNLLSSRSCKLYLKSWVKLKLKQCFGGENILPKGCEHRKDY